MTLQEKIELLDSLRNEYDDGMDDCDLEKLGSKFDELQLEVDFIYDRKHKSGQLFVCPHLLGGIPEAYEIAEEFMERAIDVIYDAIALYYRECSFWNEVTGLTSDELVKIYTRLNDIPIIRYFSVTEVELLDVRKLNNDVQ